MSRYLVYGRCLESDLAFPELARAAGTWPAHWVLTTMPHGAAPPADAPCLGEDVAQGDVRVRLRQAPGRFWLEFDDTGTFELGEGGRTLRWHRPLAPVPELEALARIDVLGRVLAVAFHMEGRLCLHGSAVSTGGAALGFLAPKFHGKSTLALAMVRAGAGLLTDDTLVVDPATPRPRALPGVHAVRLWGDSAARLVHADAASGLAEGDKLCLHDLPGECRTECPVPLGAIYLLSPAPPGDRPAATRTPLPPTAAALALVAHGKLSPLLGRRQAAVALRRAVDVARSVPVYTLSLVRDYSRLDEVVAQLQAWHRPAMSAVSSMASVAAMASSTAIAPRADALAPPAAFMAPLPTGESAPSAGSPWPRP